MTIKPAAALQATKLKSHIETIGKQAKKYDNEVGKDLSPKEDQVVLSSSRSFAPEFKTQAGSFRVGQGSAKYQNETLRHLEMTGSKKTGGFSGWDRDVALEKKSVTERSLFRGSKQLDVYTMIDESSTGIRTSVAKFDQSGEAVSYRESESVMTTGQAVGETLTSPISLSMIAATSVYAGLAGGPLGMVAAAGITTLANVIARKAVPMVGL